MEVRFHEERWRLFDAATETLDAHQDDIDCIIGGHAVLSRRDFSSPAEGVSRVIYHLCVGVYP